MDVYYREHNVGFAEVAIGLADGEITATREDDHINLRLRRGCDDGCEVFITFCFSCEEYEKLLCELSSVECGSDPCDCHEREVIVFDQDDCDEHREPKRRTPARGK